ncbi:MAG: alpha/beta hydrolase [Mesoaciditoga sp.]|nr:MAG: alpha/beta hydrolase [Mesoaciditoga sp.]HEU24995.1 alpha/beta hydrolase [Mesoaciditoga lauensis]
MPYFDSQIYYERVGNGEPLILLNGIMMSAGSWAYHVDKLKEHFDVITFDFKDQGRSSRMTKDYDIMERSIDLLNLMDHLKIKKAHIVGVSYGAHVAEHFAVFHPERVDKLIISNAVDKVDNYLRELGRSWEMAAATGNPELLFRLSFPAIYSRTFYNSNGEWIEERIKNASKNTDKEWLNGFIRLSRSGSYFDLSEEIKKIKAPTLLICADEDMITPKDTMEEMAKKICNSSFVKMQKTGHAAFYEKADLWCDNVEEFLA